VDIGILGEHAELTVAVWLKAEPFEHETKGDPELQRGWKRSASSDEWKRCQKAISNPLESLKSQIHCYQVKILERLVYGSLGFSRIL